MHSRIEAIEGKQFSESSTPSVFAGNADCVALYAPGGEGAQPKEVQIPGIGIVL